VLKRKIDEKLDRQEQFTMRQELAKKAEKQDVDMYVSAVSNQKHELEAKQKEIERELDELINNLKKELEGIKTAMLNNLNKKADYTLVDSLKE